MNRYQLNVTEMTSTVAAYMAKPVNSALWSSNVAISATMTEINGDLTTLAGLGVKQESPTTGAAVDKATLRFDYENEILRIAGQLAALGAATNNGDLEAKSDLSMATLDKQSADVLAATATRISGLVTANLAALVNYGITAADATGLDTLTTQFQAIKTKPREAVVDKKKETDQVQPLITSLLSTLRRRLDRQMLAYKQTQPEFYAGYLGARVIVDRGAPAKKKPTPPPTP